MSVATRLERWMVPRLAKRTPHLALVLTEVDGAVDKMNVPTKTWSVGNAPVSVYKQRTSGTEVTMAPGKVVVANYLIFGPVDPPYTTADRLRIEGTDYELLDLNPQVNTRSGPTHSEAVARELTPTLVG